jgi:hypothetical protein
MRARRFFFLALLLTTLTGAVAWLYSAPQRTVNQIHEAMRTGDVAALNDHINFPQLQANIKTRMARAVAQRAGVDGTSVGIGVKMLGSALMGTIVDRLVTPEWMVGMGLVGGQIAGAADPKVLEDVLAGQMDTRFQGLSDAQVVITHTHGELIVIMKRDGWDWRVVDVDGALPEDDPGSND